MRLDAATGRLTWSRSLGADARGPVAVADGIVLVADERERLTALDADSGERVWRRDAGLVAALATDDRAGAVAALSDDGALRVLALADGEERGSTPLDGIPTGLVATEGAILALTDEEFVLLDGRSAQVTGRGAGGDALVGEGAAVAVLRGASLQLLDPRDGAVASEQVVPEELARTGPFAVALADSVVLVRNDGALHRWMLR